jgi:hypothetical protein
MKVYIQESLKSKVTNTEAEILILTSTLTLHIGGRWCTSDLRVVSIDIKAYIRRWRQGLYPGIKKTGVKCL